MARLAPWLLILALATAACRSNKPSSDDEDLGSAPPREAPETEGREAPPDRERSEDIADDESSALESESTVKSAPGAAPKADAEPGSPCGCAPNDLMCSMRCARQGGRKPSPTSSPSPKPEPAPKPTSAANKCGCAPGDLMCSMRCAQK